MLGDEAVSSDMEELLANVSLRIGDMNSAVDAAHAREIDLSGRVADLARLLDELVEKHSETDERLAHMLEVDTQRSEEVKRKHEELASNFGGIRAVQTSPWGWAYLSKLVFYVSVALSFLFVSPFTALYNVIARTWRRKERRAIGSNRFGESRVPRAMQIEAAITANELPVNELLHRTRKKEHTLQSNVLQCKPASVDNHENNSQVDVSSTHSEVGGRSERLDPLPERPGLPPIDLIGSASTDAGESPPRSIGDDIVLKDSSAQVADNGSASTRDSTGDVPHGTGAGSSTSGKKEIEHDTEEERSWAMPGDSDQLMRGLVHATSNEFWGTFEEGLSHLPDAEHSEH